MNAIPGVLLIAAVWFTMEDQPMNPGLLKKGDWWGILTMPMGLAAFEVVLEDGNRKDWFGDPEIVKLALIAAIFIPAFIFIDLNKKEPLVDLRLFARRNFAMGSIVKGRESGAASALFNMMRNIVGSIGIAGLRRCFP